MLSRIFIINLNTYISYKGPSFLIENILLDRISY